MQLFYNTLAFAGLVFLGLLAIGLVVCILLGWFCFLAWVATLVGSGFGYQLPFWPCVGITFLAQVILGGFAFSVRGGK
jgi:hypothetical protein